MTSTPPRDDATTEAARPTLMEEAERLLSYWQQHGNNPETVARWAVSDMLGILRYIVEGDSAAQPSRESFDATEEDSWVCVCGNNPSDYGLSTCTADGRAIEPLVGSAWDGHYRCDKCGRVGRQQDRDAETGRIPVLFTVPKHLID